MSPTYIKNCVAFLLEVGQNRDLSGVKSHLVLPGCWSLSRYLIEGTEEAKEETHSGPCSCGPCPLDGGKVA